MADPQVDACSRLFSFVYCRILIAYVHTHSVGYRCETGMDVEGVWKMECDPSSFIRVEQQRGSSLLPLSKGIKSLILFTVFPISWLKRLQTPLSRRYLLILFSLCVSLRTDFRNTLGCCLSMLYMNLTRTPGRCSCRRDCRTGGATCKSTAAQTTIGRAIPLGKEKD